MPLVVGNRLWYYGATLTKGDGALTIIAAEEASADYRSKTPGQTPLQVWLDLAGSAASEEVSTGEGKVVLVDSEGNTYKPGVDGTFSGSISMSDQSGRTARIEPKNLGRFFVFSVPKNTQGFKLRFLDFPEFDLGYPLPASPK